MERNSGKQQMKCSEPQVIVSAVGKSEQGRGMGRVTVLSCWEDNIGALSEGGEGTSQAGMGGITAPPLCSIFHVEFN